MFSVLTQTRVQIAISDQGDLRQDGEHNRERDARGMGEEGGLSVPAEDGKAKIDSGASKHEHHSDDGHDSREAPKACQVSAVRQHPFAGVYVRGILTDGPTTYLYMCHALRCRYLAGIC